MHRMHCNTRLHYTREGWMNPAPTPTPIRAVECGVCLISPGELTSRDPSKPRSDMHVKVAYLIFQDLICQPVVTRAMHCQDLQSQGGYWTQV